MVSLSDRITVNVNVVGGGVTAPGFGIPMVAAYHDEWSERVRYFTDASDLLTANGGPFTSDHPIYLAVSQALAQNPRPERVGLGRFESAVTIDYLCTVLSAVEGRDYTVEVNGDSYTHTAAPADTPALIANALVGLINGIAGKNFTAVDNADGTFNMTGDAAGDYFCFSATPLNFGMKNNTPDGATSLTDDLANIAAENDEWYTVIPVIASTARVLAIAAYLPGACKTQIASSSDTDMLGAVASNTMEQLLGLSRERTMMAYHFADCEYLSSAIAGRGLSQNPGTINWAWQGDLSGVRVDPLTTTQTVNLDNQCGNYYINECNAPTYFSGKVSRTDRFFDQIRASDYANTQYSLDLCLLFRNTQVIRMTQGGLTMIGATISGTSDRLLAEGVYSPDTPPQTTIPDINDISDANRAARFAPGFKVDAQFSGAVNSMTLDINVQT